MKRLRQLQWAIYGGCLDRHVKRAQKANDQSPKTAQATAWLFKRARRAQDGVGSR